MTEAVDALVARIRSKGVGTSREINPFWSNQLRRLGKAVARNGDHLTLRQVRDALGYNASPLPEGVLTNRRRPDWPELMRAVQAGEMTGPGNVVEHIGALSFLQRMEVFEEYLAWVDGLQLMSAMDLARHYWYGRKLVRARGKDAGPTPCLEIGSGSGQFACRLVELGMVSHYVMVDLPEMLLNAMLLVRERAPTAEVRYGETPDFDRDGPVFWMLETSQIRQVPDRSIGAALNFYSFMEMDDEVRDFYIGEIYRTAAPRCVFYNVNRRQAKMTRRNGAVFENNPLRYPYRDSDEIVEWEPDDFQQSIRSDRFVAPTASFAVSRIARVR